MVKRRNKKSPAQVVDIDSMSRARKQVADLQEVPPGLTLAKDPKMLAKQAKFLLAEDEIEELTAQDRLLWLDARLRGFCYAARKTKDPRRHLRDRIKSEFPGLTKVLEAQIEPRIERAVLLHVEGKTEAEVDSLPTPTEEDERKIDRLFAETEPSKEMQEDADGNVVPVYSLGDEVVTENNPNYRDGPSVGRITEKFKPPKVDDLVGDKPPRTLSDLYARWPIEDDDSFYLRVDRLEPKKYQGMQAAGFVENVHGRALSEVEMQRRYGGSKYHVTLYGPDPRGKVDSGGRLKVKALTDAITVYIPGVPPLIFPIPREDPMSQQFYPAPNPQNPFGAPVARPASPSEAQMHKTDKEHEKWLFEQQLAVKKEQTQIGDKMFDSFAQFSKAQLEQQREDSRIREERHAKELEAEKEARRRQEEAVEKAKSTSSDAALQMLDRLGPQREAEIRRLESYYKEQLTTVRVAFEDQMKAMRERHEGDLRRADERLKDVETNYRMLLEQERGASARTLDQERQSWNTREKELRDQADRQVMQVKESMQLRIDDMKERHAAEVKNLERMQSQITTTMRESFEVKTAVTEQTSQMSREQLENRVQELREELERARLEAEDAKDIPKQLAKASEMAEALGFEKKDANEPKTPWERFAATAGTGIGQVLGNIDQWLPQVMSQRQQAQQAQQVRMLQAAQEQQQQRQRQQQAAQARQAAARAPQQAPPGQQAAQAPEQRRSRAVQWDSTGQEPVNRGVEPSAPLGFKAEEEPQEKNPEKSAERPVTSVEQAVAKHMEASNGASEEAPPLPPKFLEHFSHEGIYGFLISAQQAVETQTPAASFSDLFVAKYRESAAVLVKEFSPAEIVEATRQVAPNSVLVRRQGEKWLGTLWREMSSALQRANASAAVS